MPLLVLVLLVSVGSASFGRPVDSAASSFGAFVESFPAGSCRERARSLGRLEAHFSSPDVRSFFSRVGLPSAALRRLLAAETSDALVAEAIQIRRGLGAECALGERLSVWETLLETSYLRGLGVEVTPKAKVRRLFDGLLFTAEDAKRLRAKIRAAQTRPGRDLLEQVFGEAREFRGVLVVGGGAKKTPALEAVVAKACPGSGACLFWDGAALFKVALTAKPGVAAFLPELGLMALSRDLTVDPTNLLHQIVIFHELVHAAELAAAVRRHEAWTETFRVFSDWEKGADGKWAASPRWLSRVREDALVTLSHGSAYSILPDPVSLVCGSGKSARDGFAMAKTYRAVLAVNDPAEDLADHVAVFRLLPERFCFAGDAVAPRKYAWIRSHLFPTAPALSCRKP